MREYRNGLRHGAAVGLALLISGCANFGIRGQALQAPSTPVQALTIDLSRTEGVSLKGWRSDFIPAVARHAPEAFSGYGISTGVRGPGLAPAATPSVPTHRATVALERMSSGTSGNTFMFRLLYLAPNGAKLWSGHGSFVQASSDYDEQARLFVTNLAQQLDAAGLLRVAPGAPGPEYVASGRPLSGPALQAFNTHANERPPKALVLDDADRPYSAAGQAGDDARSSPAARALRQCTDAGGRGCHVIAIDDEVL